MLDYKTEGKQLTYQFEKAVENLTFPVRVNVNGESRLIHPSSDPQVMTMDEPIKAFEVDRNFYILSRDIQAAD